MHGRGEAPPRSPPHRNQGEEEVIEIPRRGERPGSQASQPRRRGHARTFSNPENARDGLHVHYSAYLYPEEESEGEGDDPAFHCGCSCADHGHAHSHFHELLLDFFAGHNLHSLFPPDGAPDPAHFYSSKPGPMPRERFAADWDAVRTDLKSEGELKHAVGKVPQQLPRPKVTFLPDTPADAAHPGVEVSWAKKTPRVEIVRYLLELRIPNCKELAGWVLIYSGVDKHFTCTRLPRGARCEFRVQGENENGKGKWSEETQVVVPGAHPTAQVSLPPPKKEETRHPPSRAPPGHKNAPATTTPPHVGAAPPLRGPFPDDGHQVAREFRGYLHRALQQPSVDRLEALIRRIRELEKDSQSPAVHEVLEDALVALQLKEEELILRNHQLAYTTRPTSSTVWEEPFRPTSSSSYPSKGEPAPSAPASTSSRGAGERKDGKGSSPPAPIRTMSQLKQVAHVRGQLKEALASNNIDCLEQAIDAAKKWENSLQRSCTDTDTDHSPSLPSPLPSSSSSPSPASSSSSPTPSRNAPSPRSLSPEEQAHEQARLRALTQLKELTNSPAMATSTDTLLLALRTSAPWAQHPAFQDLIEECSHRIRSHQETIFGRKLLQAALRSENKGEIYRCMEQLIHKRHLHGVLESEIRQCKSALERLHVAELRCLLRQFSLHPQTVPHIQQVMEEAKRYQQSMQQEIMIVQDQLHYLQSQCCRVCNRFFCSRDMGGSGSGGGMGASGGKRHGHLHHGPSHSSPLAPHCLSHPPHSTAAL